MPVNRKKRRDIASSKEERRISLKEKMAEVLELPKEIVLDFPKLTMVGRGNLVIENYKGIVEYDTSVIRINTGMGIVKVGGTSLTIKEITSEDVFIEGNVCSIEILD